MRGASTPPFFPVNAQRDLGIIRVERRTDRDPWTKRARGIPALSATKRAAVLVGKFSNTVKFNVPGKKVSPVTKVMRFGAVADAFAHQTFSVTKKVDGELPDNAKDLEYTLNITLKNDADPSVNKTYQATVKAGKSYSYPGALPLGTEVTVSEGDLPAADGVTWNEAESRVFDTAQGVTLKANNREATFKLSEDQLFALNLNNKLVPTPKPTPTPTPTPSTPPAPRLAKTGADATSLGFLAGLVTIAGVSLVAAKRRNG